MQALPPNSHDTLDVARQKLSWIVGRDVQTLDQAKFCELPRNNWKC